MEHCIFKSNQNFVYFQINDDASLNVKQAVLTVEKILTETRETMTTVTTTWESWQQKVSSSRQFKSQWHQFIQDARKVGGACVLLYMIIYFLDWFKT